MRLSNLNEAFPEVLTFWEGEATDNASSTYLDKPLDADVVVVGGGLAGLSSAVALAQAKPGRHVALLEATKIGGGASGRHFGTVAETTRDEAQLLEEQLGERGARDFTAYQRDIRSQFESLMSGIGNSCGYTKTRLLLLAKTDAGADALRRLQVAQQKWGVRSEYIESDALPKYVNCRASGGLSCFDHGWVHPMRLVRALGALAAGLGVSVFEGTPVTRIEVGRRGGIETITEHFRVRSEWLIDCTNAYAPFTPGLQKYTTPLLTHVVATEPLSAAEIGEFGWDPCHRTLLDFGTPGGRYYLQLLPSGQFLMGGGKRVLASGSEPTATESAHEYRRICQEMVLRFPHLDSAKVDRTWKGKIAVTESRYPFVRKADGCNVVQVTGCNGRGVLPMTMVGALIRSVVDISSDRSGQADERRYMELLQRLHAGGSTPSEGQRGFG